MRSISIAVTAGAVMLLVAACGGASTTTEQPSMKAAVGPSSLQPVDPFDASTCPTEDGYEVLLDCYVAAASESLDSWWDAAFTAADSTYTSPAVQWFGEEVATACGDATADVGPFYCPADETIYLQTGFMAAVGDETGAEGPYSGAIVLAHEWGHHVQALMGMDEDFDAEQAEALGEETASTRTELMADCMAGWWSGMADQAGQFPITEQDVVDAVLTLAEVGDDFQSALAGEEFDPDTWDHGTVDQRTTWLTDGMQAGADDADPFEACDTFTRMEP